MADAGNSEQPPSPNPDPPLVQASSKVVVHKIYVKDLSLESPNAPAVFNEEWQPQVEINVQNTGRKVGETVYEVVLSVTVTARMGDNVGFLVEVHQAGLFGLNVASEEAVRLLIGSTCPGILYPYARELVSDLASRGGFPPLLLQHADFDAMYQERIASGEMEAD